MNLTGVQHTTAPQLAPLPQDGGGAPKLVHPSIASRLKGRALGTEAMTPLRERGLGEDQVISRAGIKALFKKTPEELSSRRWANFLSIFPGKLGRTGWSGSSRLGDIKQLAQTYQEMSRNAPQERLAVLQQLSDALDQYGDQSTKARLSDRVVAMKEFVQGEMVSLKVQMQSPGLHDLGPGLYGPGGPLARHGAAFFEAIRTGDSVTLNRVVDEMAGGLAEGMKERGVDGDKFGGSYGREFKESVLTQLCGLHPQSDLILEMNPDGLLVAQQAMDRLYSGVVNGLTEGSGTMGEDGTLKLSGTSYAPQGGEVTKERHMSEGGAYLGDGGYGKVYVFDGSDGDKVVVKETLPEPESPDVEGRAKNLQEKAKESHREAVMHALAHGAGHENLVGFKGAVHNGTGTTICLEYCPNGDVPKMAGKLWDPELMRGLTPDQQARTRQLAVGLMLRDMARGLEHMHTNGVGHLDFKGVNVFLGSDGVAKVGDIGTGVKLEQGRYQVPMGHRYVDAPGYVAPEIMALEILPPNRVLVASPCNKDSILAVDLDKYEAALEQFSDPGPLEEFRRIKETLKGIQDTARREDSTNQDVTGPWRQAAGGLDRMVRTLKQIPEAVTGQVLDVNKADVWALGITLCELAYPGEDGKSSSPFEGAMFNKTRDNLREYARDGTKTFTQMRLERWERDHPGVLPPTDERLDALLDRMLDPDPAKRIDSSTLLQDPYFQDQALDNPLVREFVKVLTSSGSSRQEIEDSAGRVGAL